MARTHKSLEGKKVKYINPKGFVHQGIIVGCNKDIGITIMSTDKEIYLYCLNCPLSPVRKWADEEKAFMKKRFKEVIAMIDAGTVDGRELTPFEEREKLAYASADTCAFSQ